MYSFTILLILAAVFAGQGYTRDVTTAIAQSVKDYIKGKCPECEVQEWDGMTGKKTANGYEYTVKYTVFNHTPNMAEECKTIVKATKQTGQKGTYKYEPENIDCLD